MRVGKFTRCNQLLSSVYARDLSLDLVNIFKLSYFLPFDLFIGASSQFQVLEICPVVYMSQLRTKSGHLVTYQETNISPLRL